jgi:hypothetical protein
MVLKEPIEEFVAGDHGGWVPVQGSVPCEEDSDHILAEWPSGLKSIDAASAACSLATAGKRAWTTLLI